MNKVIFIICLFAFGTLQGQTTEKENIYKQRVLEKTEIDFLTSFYTQDGDNAAVSGGKGTEALTDATGTIVVSIPLNDDDVLTIDAGISAYTSASSSNVDPFDGDGTADPFQASSGASKSDGWLNFSGSYSHSSDDRNKIWSANISISNEYDYFSSGIGASYTRLFNERNTELSLKGNVFIDKWKALYPRELIPFTDGENGLNNKLFSSNVITGNSNYNPVFSKFSGEQRNSYSIGLGLYQILHKKVQGALAIDLVQQQGLLSTPFQRVYFADVEDSFIDNFHLADDVEKLPDSRFKVAIGGRIHWYFNEWVTTRTFYRYYFDNWGIKSHTANIEIPIKITRKFTLYPSYRYYSQTASDHFHAYNQAISTEDFYTSDHDLSEYTSNQFGFGVSYTDPLIKSRIWKLGLKSIDLKFYQYNRNTSFKSSIVTAGFKFVLD